MKAVGRTHVHPAWWARRGLLLAILIAVVALMPSPVWAQAVSEASHGQCRARWSDALEAIRVTDEDIHDSDHCYVRYGPSREEMQSRAAVEQDSPRPLWVHLRADLPQEPVVFWQVCKEREHDPDVCGDVQRDERA
jgi:hypothetical protein